MVTTPRHVLNYYVQGWHCDLHCRIQNYILPLPSRSSWYSEKGSVESKANHKKGDNKGLLQRFMTIKDLMSFILLGGIKDSFTVKPGLWRNGNFKKWNKVSRNFKKYIGPFKQWEPHEQWLQFLLPFSKTQDLEWAVAGCKLCSDKCQGWCGDTPHPADQGSLSRPPGTPCWLSVGHAERSPGSMVSLPLSSRVIARNWGCLVACE